MLDKKIKKVLIETKEKKEKRLIEEKIIKDRVSMILEGIKTEEEFKKLSESKRLKLSVKFLNEMSYLSESGLLNEQDFGNVLKSMFGSKMFGVVTQSLMEPLINKVLLNIGFEKGFIKNFLISYLTSRPSDMIKSFSDCKLMTKLISEGIVEAMILTTQEKSGVNGIGYSVIRNSLGGVLESNQFVSSIENGLGGVICSLLDKFTNNTKEVVNKLKGDTTSVNSAMG